MSIWQRAVETYDCHSDQAGKQSIKYPVAHLRSWAESAFSHPTVRAILAYVESGTIVDDLAGENIIELDESGKPLSKYDKDMIRWRVMNTGDNDACYKDTSLFDAFIGYHHTLQSTAQKGLCMISGNEELIAKNRKLYSKNGLFKE